VDTTTLCSPLTNNLLEPLPQTYEPFIESIKKRGLNLSDVVCSTYSIGWFGEVKSKRVLKLLCFYIEGTVNLYLRPLEGITLVVDLDEMKIVEYFDRFIVPVPKAERTEYRASKQKPPFGPHLNGAAIMQPDRPRFKIDGHIVRLVNIFFFWGLETRF
jgi:primary-amine oxidase